MDVHIDNMKVPNNLIDLRDAINMVTKENILTLNLRGDLRKTTTVLELADRLTVAPYWVIEDVMVSIDSWGYPTNLFFI